VITAPGMPPPSHRLQPDTGPEGREREEGSFGAPRVTVLKVFGFVPNRWF